MTTTNESFSAGVIPGVTGDQLKTDVLGRTRMSLAQREALLDTFETSSMTGQAFAFQHGIKIQSFASWIQKRRRDRGDYQNESVCRKLRMRKNTTPMRSQKTMPPAAALNLIEVDLRKDPTASAALEVVNGVMNGVLLRSFSGFARCHSIWLNARLR